MREKQRDKPLLPLNSERINQVASTSQYRVKYHHNPLLPPKSGRMNKVDSTATQRAGRCNNSRGVGL
jgi:hypothetical protein